MLLKNISALLGENLDFVTSVDIQIKNKKFQKIHPKIESSLKEDTFDCEGLLLIPGFINSHTHIADSIGKDISLNGTVNQKIHPMFGIKSKILKNTSNENLSTFMKNTCHSMIRKGITTFVDFREGGLDGANLLKKVSSDTPIRSIILGRLDFHQNSLEIKKNSPLPTEKIRELPSLVKACDGIGISGANEHSTSVLTSYSKTEKIRAIHSSETQESVRKSKQITGKSETLRALSVKPDFLIHMTHASKSDLQAVSKKTSGIVICPRANSSLAEGIPDIQKMENAGCLLALGTDNVMINSPDMFREMDFLWKVTMGIKKKRIDPKNILKMATVNGGKILKKDIGIIQNKKIADCIFLDKHALDLEPMHNPYASIVHRASESTIKAVMIEGKIVHGKI
ncbi:MAG: amidohydrolase family protein [Nitrosopumilus sp.]|jgi:cytosine/adenosine deaminase-related metal-dependent hydrolase|nr:amidohydrolase family protein [Nitrosopumilus sp.]MBT3861424.1 amidohydrolase family protein [Nitrosopumilus sp.]MBT3956640.1 amidohydrolase family protein [Nitrosopumilus sp.]MBT4299310.1 amidohydrolase family protein [Nitrosopumilus sp.]MBT5279161.1 amidohydrolase family protein [Nitrosopumilus sp.]